jgi:hypothetical protein
MSGSWWTKPSMIMGVPSWGGTRGVLHPTEVRRGRAARPPDGCPCDMLAPMTSWPTPTVPAAGTPGPAAGRGCGPTARGPAAPSGTPPTSAWRSPPPSRRCGPDRTDRGGLGLDLRRELLPGPMVGGLAAPGLDELEEGAGRQPRPVGAVHRPGAPARRRHLPLGEGPRRRPDERHRRPPGGGRRRRAAGRSGAVLPDISKLPTDATGRRRRGPTAGARRDGRLPALPIAEHGVACSATDPRSSAGTTRTRRLAVRPSWPRSSTPAAELDPDLVVVSGLRLGAEQLGAEAALELGSRSSRSCPIPTPTTGGPRRRGGASPSCARRVPRW